MRLFIGVFLISALFFSCKKDPGKGGRGTITGKVYLYEYDDFGWLIDSGYVADDRVYISYGNNTTIDDDVRTSYTGEYKFEWLQPGNYTVWILSRCDSCGLREHALKKNVTISGTETVTLPTFIKIK